MYFRNSIDILFPLKKWNLKSSAFLREFLYFYYKKTKLAGMILI